MICERWDTPVANSGDEEKRGDLVVEEVIDSPRGEDRLSVAHPEVAQVVDVEAMEADEEEVEEVTDALVDMGVATKLLILVPCDYVLTMTVAQNTNYEN